MKKIYVMLCILALVIIIIGFTNRSIADNNIIVNSGQSIQSAINSAPSGSTITVNPGTYSETVTIDKNITLNANGTVNLSELHISGTGATVKGFILSGSYPLQLSNTNGVRILNNTINSSLNGIMDSGTNTNLYIAGNTLHGTDPMYGNNIAFEGVTNNAIIENNSLSGAELGLLFDVPSSNNIVRNNNIVGNVQLLHPGDPIKYEGTGVYTIDGSTNFQILDNNVTYERDGIAIQQMHNGTASGFIVMGNTCTKNMNAIWMAVSNSMISNNILTGNNEGVDITGTGNTIKSNIITNNTSVGIALTTKTSTDSNTVSNNTLSGNGGNYYTAGPGTVIGE